MKSKCKLVIRLSACLVIIIMSVWLVFTGIMVKDRLHPHREASSTAEAARHKPKEEILRKKAWIHSKNTSTTTNVRYHIGVMTSQKYLGTRAEAVYHTWGKEAGSLSFYVGELAEVPDTLPVTVLTGVDDSGYPPQPKAFEMLRYWCTHFIDRFDWFVRTDDDTYIKVALLERLLQGLNPNVKYYIGRPGDGYVFERKSLALYKNWYCVGQTVIFSKAVMTALCPHIDHCQSHVATTHEDTEIGRCVFFKAGVQCHAGKNMSKLFVNTNKSAFSKDLSQDEKLRDVLSAHAVKQPADMYNLHFQYLLWLRTAKLNSPKYQDNPFGIQSKKVNLTKDICDKFLYRFSREPDDVSYYITGPVSATKTSY